MAVTVKPADQLRFALLAAICAACLYSFVHTMFLSTPAQGQALSPNIKGYCRAPLAQLQSCQRKQVRALCLTCG